RDGVPCRSCRAIPTSSRRFQGRQAGNHLRGPTPPGKAFCMKRRTGQDQSITRNWRPATQAVRGGTARSEWGETSEAIFLTSGYAYDCAGDAAARFAGEQVGMTYSRLQNPTVQMLEERIALL